MKLKNRNFNLITIEVTKKEIDESGFDKIWDEIRETYSAKDYITEEIKSSPDGAIVFVNLKYIKNLKTIGF